MLEKQRCRLYVDESGDHSSCDVSSVGKRYLGLIGVMFRNENSKAFIDPRRSPQNRPMVVTPKPANGNAIRTSHSFTLPR